MEMAEEKKGIVSKIADKIWKRTPRAQSTFDRLHIEAGFIPLLNMTDTESRRQEIRTLLSEGKTDETLLSPKKQKKLTSKVASLFFTAGDPWYRGLDNRELAQKVVCFLENITDVGHLDAFIKDLFEEAMQLLSLSWQALDVTNTPWYVVESRPVVMAGKGAGSPEARTDDGGVLMMKQRIEELEKLMEANKQ